MKGNYQLDIIDILDNPDAANENNVVTVPMIVMDSPKPSVTITGSLYDMIWYDMEERHCFCPKRFTLELITTGQFSVVKK